MKGAGIYPRPFSLALYLLHYPHNVNKLVLIVSYFRKQNFFLCGYGSISTLLGIGYYNRERPCCTPCQTHIPDSGAVCINAG
jgi:hypothetical protein